MKVKLQEVLEALDGVGMDMEYYYDTKNEEILMIFDGMVNGETDPDLIEDIEEGFIEDYIPLPRQYDMNEYRMMEEFIYDLPAGRAQDALDVAIRGKGAFRRFKDRLYDFDLQEKWYKYRDDCYEQIARDWCERFGIEIGTLVIDEAGQAQPQMAVGALYRARKAIIVGDPKQVEPVVTDDLKLLKEAYSEPVFANYKNKSLSVQSCADIMNPFGTSYDNGTDYPDWVGCPLLVHRRCISPMYEISNRISYNGIMKQQTLPPSDGKVESFIYEKSQWINVTGVENGHGDHYVAEQGNVVCEMVNVSFQKAIKISKMQVDTKPSLYIITPFTTVVSGLRKAIGTYATRNKNSALGVSTSLDEWLYDNIGTVHKFQGKEANEVIFVLGCDESQKNRYAVKGFVNSNIVNVAATRAKYRFYMVGDQKVWGKNEYVNEAKSIMDRLLIEDAEENN